MFALLQKANMLNMPVDIQCHLFDTFIWFPKCFCMGVKFWQSNDISTVENIQLKFMKHILQVNKSTLSTMT